MSASGELSLLSLLSLASVVCIQKDGCTSHDVLALDIAAPSEKTPVLQWNCDVQVWTPFVAKALHGGAQASIHTVETYLKQEFATGWSNPMLSACIQILTKSGYLQHLEEQRAKIKHLLGHRHTSHQEQRAPKKEDVKHTKQDDAKVDASRFSTLGPLLTPAPIADPL